ncbi:phage holin family protein [Heyndrickxia sp. FSL K6-6286]|uniref:phage holin family protein n=1 Tax=Heyndrickxia sp. FSL K6-6286 TaxID=2921510 RepID=UPI003159C16E
MEWLIGILINALLFVAMAGYFDGFEVSSFGSAIIASFILSILNILVRPILIILTFPITILTLGIFLFVINTFTLLMTDRIMGDSFDFDGFGTAFIVAVIMSVANLIIQKAVFDKNDR